MSGPEHYREAERLLDLSGREAEIDGGDEGPYVAFLGVCVARAQVHATLALTAATADAYAADRGYSAWLEVVR